MLKQIAEALIQQGPSITARQIHAKLKARVYSAPSYDITRRWVNAYRANNTAIQAA